MKVYCLFSSFTDECVYCNDTLVGIFDNEELAYANLVKYETMVKRYKELMLTDKELTDAEWNEYEELEKNDWIHNEFYINEYELNEINF